MKVPLHKHILIRAQCTNPPKDGEVVYYWLKEFVEKIGMKIIRGPFSAYVDAEGNRGMTAAVMIETSHIAFHVWDESDPSLLQFDLYTCSHLDSKLVLEEVKKFFNVKVCEYLVYDRENGFKLIDAGREVYSD
jgi:S-adenosylmethionine/arginine decarboxylase-like enzyme